MTTVETNSPVISMYFLLIMLLLVTFLFSTSSKISNVLMGDMLRYRFRQKETRKILVENVFSPRNQWWIKQDRESGYM